MSAKAYREKLTQKVTLSNGAEFKVKTISAKKLIKLLKAEGLTISELDTIKSGSKKFEAVLKIQDILLREYVVEPKINDGEGSISTLGLEEISIRHTAELVAHITGAGDLFRTR